jgi:uncharacterized protein YcbK (DUF882 family)
MRRMYRRVVVVAALVGMVLGMSGSSWARTIRTRVHAGLRSSMHGNLRSSARVKIHPVVMTGEEVVPGVMPEEVASNTVGATDVANGTDEVADATPVQAQIPEDGKPYRLRMSNLHTGEDLDIVYRIGDTYIPEALAKLNYFLRDHNTQDVIDYSPTEFDVLHAMLSRLGRLNSVIDIVCGYRTPETNEALRHDAPWTGVAEHSQHMEGHAIDIRVPGVPTARLRDAALSLHAGGVGYYPVSQFVHVDVGPVREWVFGTKQRRMIMARATHRRVHGTRSGIVSGQ